MPKVQSAKVGDEQCLLPLLHRLLKVHIPQVSRLESLQHIVHRHPAIRVPGHDLSLAIEDAIATGGGPNPDNFIWLYDHVLQWRGGGHTGLLRRGPLTQPHSHTGQHSVVEWPVPDGGVTGGHPDTSHVEGEHHPQLGGAVPAHQEVSVRLPEVCEENVSIPATGWVTTWVKVSLVMRYSPREKQIIVCISQGPI